MNMELNKIAGAVLGTALAVFGLNEASNIIYHSAIPEKPGFAIEVALPDLGCRNWTGSPVHACTIVAGDLYLFRAGWGGCRGTPPDFERPVLEFLDGLVLAEP